MIDANSPLPLYHQLAEELVEYVRNGVYVPGSKIPSEHELAAQYRIGRPTVRQATDTLIQRGVLVRRRGSGTYVRGVPVEIDLFSLAGTLISFRDRGIELAVEIVDGLRRACVDDAAHPFHGQETIRLARLSRVRRGTSKARGGPKPEPVLLEEIDLLANRFAGLDQVDLEGRSLSEVVRSRYGMVPRQADQTFRVDTLSPGRALLLELPSGAAVLRVDRTLRFQSGEAAVFARMYCRTDRFVFSQHIGG